MTKKDVIAGYTLNWQWTESLREMDDQLWLSPIKLDKWSVADIISHLIFWDRYILEDRLPLMKPGASLEGGPSAEETNTKASKYAHSGISKDQLIDEYVNVRGLLIHYLESISEEEFDASLTIKGKAISISAYIKGVIEHENHHINQIIEFMKG